MERLKRMSVFAKVVEFGSLYRRRQTATDERFVHQSDGVKTGR